MRVNSNKQWYEYEADKNRVYAIMVYPSPKNPKKYIIDLKCSKEDNTTYFNFIYDTRNRIKQFTISAVLMVINTISSVQKTKPAVYFYEEIKNETQKDEPTTVE